MRWLGGDAGKRGAAKPSRAADVERFDPPSDLPAHHLAVWQRLAPHAFEAKTLTPGTAAAFKDLCVDVAERDALLAKDERLDWHKTAARVRTAMKEFRLAPMGKPMADETDVPDDPFAEFDPSAGVQ